MRIMALVVAIRCVAAAPTMGQTVVARVRVNPPNDATPPRSLGEPVISVGSTNSSRVHLRRQFTPGPFHGPIPSRSLRLRTKMGAASGRQRGPYMPINHPIRRSAAIAAGLAVWFGAAAAADAPRPGEMVQTARLMDGLRGLPTKRAAIGDIEHQKGLIQTERYLMTALEGMGYTPTLQPLTWNLKKQAEAEKDLPKEALRRPPPPTTDELAATVWHNIIVELPGTDLASEVLIVGAHFDAVPRTPGADDNGSGTAALLELGRVLKDRPMRRTVRMIFFNLEEIGLRGSADYLKSYRPTLDAKEQTLVGMMSLEMLGFFTDAPGSQTSPIPPIEGVFDPPTVGDFIAIAGIKRHQPFSQKLAAEMMKGAPGLKAFAADFAPFAPPDFLRSDHAPFLLSGYPAVMVTDTSNFRNPNYHKPSDTVGTLDPVRYALVVRGLAEAIYVIAEPVTAGAVVPVSPVSMPETGK